MAAVAALSSSIAGTALPTLPARRATPASRAVKVVASGKKLNVKQPLGPSGDTKGQVDASGSPLKGKGTFQFVKKYGANVDGYSPIYDPDTWSTKGDTYEGNIALWAVTFAALLGVGVFLVFGTSALA